MFVEVPLMKPQVLPLRCLQALSSHEMKPDENEKIVTRDIESSGKLKMLHELFFQATASFFEGSMSVLTKSTKMEGSPYGVDTGKIKLASQVLSLSLSSLLLMAKMKMKMFWPRTQVQCVSS